MTRRITVRHITEAEVLGCGWDVNTPLRWVIVDADATDMGLFLVGGLVMAGSDHLIAAIDQAKQMAARRKGPHYELALPEELRVLAESIEHAYDVVCTAGANPDKPIGDRRISYRVARIEDAHDTLRDVVVAICPQIRKEWL